MSKQTFQASFTQTMQAAGLAGVVWGSATAPGSPYYRLVPEPDQIVNVPSESPFPFVVFDMKVRTKEWQFEKSYVETYDVVVDVYGLESHVGAIMSPYTPGSVLYWLNGLCTNPGQLNGDTFGITGFNTGEWELSYDETARAPGLVIGGQRILKATMPAEAMLVFNQA